MAALVLSVAAFVVSVVSAVFAGMAAVAARGVRRIEQARHLEERRPRFTAQALPGTSLPGCDLALTLVSDEPLADVLTEILYLRGGISFKYGAKGVKSLSFAYAHDPMSGEPACSPASRCRGHLRSATPT